MTKRKKQPLGQTIGGVLFGFEQAVLRNQPPPQEMVHHARPDDPIPAGDGGFMTLEITGPAVPRETDASPTPEVLDLAPRVTVAVRVRQPMAQVDVGALVGRHLPRLASRLPSFGLAIDGPPYVRYCEWGAGTADLELGFPVSGDPAALAPLDACTEGDPGSSTLPGGPCAVVLHQGSYAGLPITWGRLQTWIWDQGLEPAGPPWESYLDSPDLVVPGVLRTEVIRPVRGGTVS